MLHEGCVHVHILRMQIFLHVQNTYFPVKYVMFYVYFHIIYSCLFLYVIFNLDIWQHLRNDMKYNIINMNKSISHKKVTSANLRI